MNDHWIPPESFDEYRLVERLGQGGLGFVYVARDTLLDRLVAIKFIADVEPSADARARFLREARTSARLQHPNVLAVHRIGHVDGRPYIVSELLRGQSLDKVEKPVSAQRLLEIALDLSRGLAAAHRRGVLHRDIKPSNVVLGDDGAAKLIDFGLAKFVASPAAPDPDPTPRVDVPIHDTLPPAKASLEETLREDATLPQKSPEPPKNELAPLHLTREGALIGTPSFMAPELWKTEPATPRSDIYALGALLHELASGLRPFDGEDLRDLMIHVLFHQRTPLKQLAPSCDPRIEAIIERCLSREPRDRYATGEELREALEAIAIESGGPGITSAIDQNPYRGLATFDAEHRSLFFGRSAEIASVLARMQSEPLVIIAGESGAGKSSLCRAGVLPRIADGKFFPNERWAILTIIPGKRPMHALAGALAALSGETAAAASLEGVVDQVRRALRSASGLVLFIDQLEELTTLAAPDEVREFAETIGALTASGLHVRVLATVRGDFLTRIAVALEIGQRLSPSMFVLGPMSRTSLREAIVGPARTHDVSFEPESLVDQLVEQVGREHGGLPMLQFALSELWEVRDRGRRVITERALAAIGGIGGALARHADRVLAELVPNARSVAKKILVRLVTSARTRATLSMGEVAALGPEAPETIDVLVRARLVRARELDGEIAFELVHEALIDGWSTLRGWIDSGADKRAIEERVSRAAEEWTRVGKDALWQKRQLVEASVLDPEELGAREREFLDASRRALRVRAFMRVAAVAGAALLVASVPIAGAYRSRRITEEAVDLRKERGMRALELARDRAASAAKTDTDAYLLFDTLKAKDGEVLWASARDSSRAALDSFRTAANAFESALALDASRADVRELFVAVELERAKLFERERRSDQVEELLARIPQWDPNALGEWNAKAKLSITTRPSGARARIARYAIVPNKKWPLDPARELGATPIAAQPIEPGSYLIELDADGMSPVRYPVLVHRGEQLALEVELLFKDRVPRGFAYVPTGRFSFGSDERFLGRNGFGTVPVHEANTSGYFIGVHETTNAEWIAYLDAAGVAPETGHHQKTARGWTFTIEDMTEDHKARTFAEGEVVQYPHPRHAPKKWERLPVGMISFAEATAYARWLAESGRVPRARLCSDMEWERATRGADERIYPRGDKLDAEDANIRATHGEPANDAWGADEVGSYPSSASPFGVEDLAGNVAEWVVSSIDPSETPFRGSTWLSSIDDPVPLRLLASPGARDLRIGVRICADVVR